MEDVQQFRPRGTPSSPRSPTWRTPGSVNRGTKAMAIRTSQNSNGDRIKRFSEGPMHHRASAPFLEAHGSFSRRSYSLVCSRDPLPRTDECDLHAVCPQDHAQLVAKPGVLVKTRRNPRQSSLRRKGTSQNGYRPRRFLLTRNEACFFKTLVALIGHRYAISCKVRLADIITCSEEGWRYGTANRISQKHIDFVLSCPRSSRIVAAVELDDRSHRRPERERRDAFVNRLFQNMRVRLIRVPASWTYDEQVVKDILADSGIVLEQEIDHGSISPKPNNLRRAHSVR